LPRTNSDCTDSPTPRGARNLGLRGATEGTELAKHHLRRHIGLGGRLKTTDPLAELVLVKHLLHDDPDVRDAACRGVRLLPRAQAQTWLTLRLREEADDEVRRTIEQELELIPIACA
jgi:hypothetical protein